MDLILKAVSSAPSVTGDEAGHPAPGAPVDVTLCEDAEGRLALLLPEVPPDDLARIGRTRIEARDLTPGTLATLAARGRVAVEGPDALNALLALTLQRSPRANGRPAREA